MGELGIAASKLARKHNIHPALPSRWKKESYADQDIENPGEKGTERVSTTTT
jgi:transposase-like protein